MANEVYVGYGDSASDTAVLLLEAAEKADQPAEVVRTGDGGFYVPEDIAKAAGVDYLGDGPGIQNGPALVPSDPDTYGEPAAKDVPVKKAQANQEAAEQSAAKKAAKKAPAKRAPAKKATAKKAAPKASR